MCIVVFGGDDKPGGVLVNAVDDAGALFTADSGKTAAAVVKQSVDKRSVGMPRSGVNDHTSRLVDNY